MKNILVVCTGNICRSPIAAALLQYELDKKNLPIEVSSAGISALVNHAADPLAKEVTLEKKGVDLSNHRGRQITLDILLQSDLVLVMELAQQRQIEFKFPSTCGRVHRLGKWTEFDIPDPYRRSKEVFEHVFTLIEQGINEWQVRLWN